MHVGKLEGKKGMNLATRNQIELPDSWDDPLEDTVEKKKYPRALALDVAKELCDVLRPLCVPDRLKVCGSLRRMKAEVGDVEIVFVPRTRLVRTEQRDLFGTLLAPAVEAPETDALFTALLGAGALGKRLKCDGTQTWGTWIKLAVHRRTEVPVDFFSCTEDAWWNLVTCRTGGALSNVAVASAAKAMGWKWNMSPQSPGFDRLVGLAVEVHPVASEREVFEFVGLPYLQPEARR